MTILTKRDVVEMCEVRIGLEATAARSLAGTITPEQLAELRRLAINADRAESMARTRAAWDRAEEAFHRRLLDFAGNARIVDVLQRQGLLERLLTLPLKNWRRCPRLDIPTHLDVVDALATGDPELCHCVTRAHAEARKQLLLAGLEEDRETITEI